MEMIDLYVKEVGRNLPETMRADIEAELRSMIEDTLEDESQQQGRSIDDEELLVTILKRLGPPQKVAASYLPPKYLIGPELYPLYVLILRIVLSVLVVVGVVSSGVSLGLSIGQSATVGQAILQSVGQALGSLVNGLIWAAGMVTLIFALIQWLAPHAEGISEGISPAWDPRKMKSEPDPELVKPGGQMAEILLNLAALILFNFFSQWVGIASFRDGHWTVVPILTGAFLQYIPWFSLVWVLSIGMRILLIRDGRWNRLTRWLDVVLDGIGVVIGFRLLTGGAIIAFPPDMISRLGWGVTTPEALSSAGNWINTVVRVLIGIGMLTQAFGLIQKLYRLLFKARFSEAMRNP